MHKWIFSTIFLAAMSFTTSAQEEGLTINIDNSYEPVGDITPKHTFNMTVGLPNTVANKGFDRMIRGVVEVNPYYYYHLKNSIGFGVGFRYIHGMVNRFKTPEPLTGVMHSYGGFVKFGYEKFYTTRFAVDFGMKVGYMNTIMRTTLNKEVRGGDYKFDYGFVEPTVGFILSATENSSYRLSFGYTITGFKFHPHMLGTEMVGGLNDKDLKNVSQIFTLSLGYTCYISKKGK